MPCRKKMKPNARSTTIPANQNLFPRRLFSIWKKTHIPSNNNHRVIRPPIIGHRCSIVFGIPLSWSNRVRSVNRKCSPPSNARAIWSMVRRVNIVFSNVQQHWRTPVELWRRNVRMTISLNCLFPCRIPFGNIDRSSQFFITFTSQVFPPRAVEAVTRIPRERYRRILTSTRNRFHDLGWSNRKRCNLLKSFPRLRWANLLRRPFYLNWRHSSIAILISPNNTNIAWVISRLVFTIVGLHHRRSILPRSFNVKCPTPWSIKSNRTTNNSPRSNIFIVNARVNQWSWNVYIHGITLSISDLLTSVSNIDSPSSSSSSSSSFVSCACLWIQFDLNNISLSLVFCPIDDETRPAMMIEPLNNVIDLLRRERCWWQSFWIVLQEHRPTSEESKKGNRFWRHSSLTRIVSVDLSLQDFICETSSEDEEHPPEFYAQVDRLIDERTTWRKWDRRYISSSLFVV